MVQKNDYLKTKCLFPFEPLVQLAIPATSEVEFNMGIGLKIKESDYISTNTHFSYFLHNELKNFVYLPQNPHIFTNMKHREVEKHCLNNSKAKQCFHSRFIRRETTARIKNNRPQIQQLHQ